RASEPFQIIEAMGDEVAEHAAAAVAGRLPTSQALLNGAVLDMPVHRDVTQAAERAAVEQVLGAQPGEDVREVEVDRRGLAALARGVAHGAGGIEGAGERLLREHRLA